MKKAIYIIINNINKKAYIGQSIDPERRFKEHCYNREKYISLIDKAIHKYGKDNFSLQILGWFENYNEMEKYYIKYYRTLIPNGYNIAIGGEEPPILKGEKNPSHKITSEIANLIKKDLLNFNIGRKTIIKKYNISYDILKHINEGDSWRDNSLNYPLRPSELEINKIKAQKVIEMLKNTNLSQKEIGARVGWNRSAVTMINIGKNHFKENLSYPIRSNTN